VEIRFTLTVEYNANKAHIAQRDVAFVSVASASRIALSSWRAMQHRRQIQ